MGISCTICPELPTLSLGSLLTMETIMVSASQGAYEDLMKYYRKLP